MQSWAWGQFNEALGHKVYRFTDKSYAVMAVELSLPMGKNYLYCPKGPVGNPSHALEDLKKFSQDQSVLFVRLEPQQQIGLPHAAKEVQPHLNWMVGLEGTEEQLLINMKPKTRYNVNLAQRKKVTVREGGKDDLLVLWQMMLETASRNKFRLYPQSYYLKMFEVLNPNFLKILIAEYQGKPLAGMFLTFYSDTATYLHGGSSNSNKDAMAPYLLHWEAMRLAKDLGYKFYDFGGISYESELAHAWAGISRFKKGFDGFEVRNPGAYDLIFSPVWYNVYKQARLVRRLMRPA